MFRWLKDLFDRGEVVGWKVVTTGNNWKETEEYFGCTSDEALEANQMRILKRVLFSGNPEVLICNAEATPIRRKRRKVKG